VLKWDEKWMELGVAVTMQQLHAVIAKLVVLEQVPAVDAAAAAAAPFLDKMAMQNCEILEKLHRLEKWDWCWCQL
jgi:hypothetical protein